MMTLTGRPLLWTLLLLLGLTSRGSLAAVEATIDRDQIALGDTLQLVISATEDDEELSTVQLDTLMRDWEVLSRNTRSNTSIINGKRSHNRQLQLEITPLRKGVLQIPAFAVGNAQTRPILVRVADAPQLDPGSETVLFEAEVDSDSVYVQGQLILTLRLQQAINLDGRSISDLQLPGSFVVPLEQKSFQRRVNGKPWLVHEVRYAIFPEQSGTLEIPAQSFSARESAPRRSIFDNSRGRLIRLNSKPLQVEVLPRPSDFTGNTWLPARNILVEEEWSADPEKLRAGESITRTLRLRGEGLQGAQLPPILLPQTDGLKHYPDQPSIADAEISTGLLGTRTDSVAIVPTRAGTVTLPAVSIPWWDTQAQVMRNAEIPARTLQVAPAVAEVLADSAQSSPAVTQAEVTTGRTDSGNWPWQLLALACALGWLITALLWWRSGRIREPLEEPATAVLNPRAAYKSLLAACAADQPQQARKQLILWASARSGHHELTTLQQAADSLGDDALAIELKKLEQNLYGSSEGNWRGGELRAIVERLQREKKAKAEAGAESLGLYPA